MKNFKVLLLISVCFFNLCVFAANHEFSTINLQDVLLRGRTLSGYDASGSRSFAYKKLHDKLSEIVNLDDANAITILASKPDARKTKFCHIVRTLVNFVGWDNDSSELLVTNSRDYSYYLRLIAFAEPHETKPAQKRNFAVAKAKLKLLALKERMRTDGLSYDVADPGAIERKAIYDQLDSVKGGVKVRLIEQAYLIIRCGYLPTGKATDDWLLAKGFIDEYYAARSSGSDESTSSSAPSRNTTVTAAPHLNITTTQSSNIRDLASQLAAEILAKQVRLAQPDENRDISRGSSSEGGDGGGPSPVLAQLAQQGEDLDIDVDVGTYSPSDNGTDNNSTTSKTAQSKDELDTEKDEKSSPSDNGSAETLLMEHEEGSSDDSDREASSSSSSSSAAKRGKKKTKEEQKAHYDNIIEARINNPDATYAGIAAIVGNGATEDSVKLFITRNRPELARGKEKFSKIAAALAANKNKTYAEIAAIVGNGATQSSVTHYVNRHAPEYKRHNVKNRRTSAEIEAIHAKIKKVIDEHESRKSLKRQEICKKASIDSSTLDGFYTKYPAYRPTNNS